MRWISLIFLLLTPAFFLAEEAKGSAAEPVPLGEAFSSPGQEGKKVIRRERKGKMTAYRFRNSEQKQLFIDSISAKRMDRKGMQTAMPEFKVPAIQQVVVNCEIAMSTMICVEELGEARKCPSEVEIKIPGQNAPAKAAVDCIGPDANGECDCEFAN